MCWKEDGAGQGGRAASRQKGPSEEVVFTELTSRAGRTGGLEAVLGRGGSRCKDFEARAWRGSLRKSREAQVARVKGMGNRGEEAREAGIPFRSQVRVGGKLHLSAPRSRDSGRAREGLRGTYMARGQHAWDQKQLFLQP